MKPDAHIRNFGQSFTSQFESRSGQPLHFAIDGDSDHRYMPYYATSQPSLLPRY